MDSISTLGRYCLIAEVGRGGMGIVYQAHDPSLERTVAIKLLAPHLAWEQPLVERFLREARAAARLHHPGIIEIYDVGQDGAHYYFVMPYLQGPTLKQRLAQAGRLALPEALSIARQLAEALDYVHHEGVIHRDVKPANVLFDGSGHAVLTDLGIARTAQETRLTAVGDLIGSPQYMAPEQVLGQAVDGRADQYVLAVLVFELLVGRVPFDADTATAVLYKQVHEPPQPLAPLCPQVPPAFEIALRRALAKSPQHRYPSCQELVAALQRALAAPPAAERALAAAPPPPAQETRLLDNAAEPDAASRRQEAERLRETLCALQERKRRIEEQVAAEAWKQASSRWKEPPDPDHLHGCGCVSAGGIVSACFLFVLVAWLSSGYQIGNLSAIIPLVLILAVSLLAIWKGAMAVTQWWQRPDDLDDPRTRDRLVEEARRKVQQVYAAELQGMERQAAAAEARLSELAGGDGRQPRPDPGLTP